jgi:hypothetical protein
MDVIHQVKVVDKITGFTALAGEHQEGVARAPRTRFPLWCPVLDVLSGPNLFDVHVRSPDRGPKLVHLKGPSPDRSSKTLPGLILAIERYCARNSAQYKCP